LALRSVYRGRVSCQHCGGSKKHGKHAGLGRDGAKPETFRGQAEGAI